MAKKKSSWLTKIAGWVQGSLQRFAEEGFSEGKKSSRKKAGRRTSSLKPKPKKKSSAKNLKVKPSKKSALKKFKAPVKPKPVKASASSVVSKRPALVKGKPKAALKPVVLPKAKPLPGIIVGKISHYFEKANACAFRVENVELKEGSEILIQGASTKLKMKVKSIQINRIPVPSGKPGEDIGIGVLKPVQPGDTVYLLKKP
ncbi:MAG TPA: hypothetical protein DIS66_05740 [Candidatus Omnitrophica bacterium]|nr:hypothetical protein [Candidatus Omnitrophota bacterium]